VVICLERGAVCLRMVQLTPLHLKTPSSLASFKSRLVLPFWHRLTQAVLKMRLLNGCSSRVGPVWDMVPRVVDFRATVVSMYVPFSHHEERKCAENYNK